MSKQKPKQELASKEMLSLRLDPKTLKRIEEVVIRYHSLHFRPGFSIGKPPVLSRSEVIRWAIAKGLAAMEAKLTKAEEKKRKGGAR